MHCQRGKQRQWIRRAVLLAAVFHCVFVPSTAWADVGGAVPPEQILRTWNFDPVLLLNLLFLCWLYRRGDSDRFRRGTRDSPAAYRRRLAFAGGMLALILALVSPLDALSEQLSSAHMLQHLLLMMVAAPLFLLAVSTRTLFVGLPGIWRRRINAWRRYRFSRRLSAVCWNPLFAWSLQLIVLWFWHVPRFYQAALNHLAIHDLQHLSFFFSALVFWRVLLDPNPHQRLNWGVGALYLFAASLQTMALGVFLALSPHVWYPAYQERPLAWGLTPLEDQQSAGFLMWMPGAMMYGVIAALLLAYRLQESRLESQCA